MTYKPLLSLCIILILMSCGSKRLVSETSGTTDLATANVIKKHYENAVSFETLAGRLKVRYQDEKQTQNVSVSIRMQKDKAIWMSANILGIPLAKVLITPNSVKYYEKISGSYFDGDFRLLSDVLGTELDFNKVQNILLGQTIYDLRQEPYILETSDRGYVLQPKKQFDLFTRLFLLNASTYKTEAQQLVNNNENQSAIVTYPTYQTISGQVFPNEINIVANQNNKNTLIDIEYRSVELNVDVSFPFSIPSGYDEVELK